ncbi:MAG: hypothetical protein MUF49_18125 [Oculatellaceae cyanobacterium Prado106]|nr:hypothetical protein [Oculatellaceae cyanobacterium Prado106]
MKFPQISASPVSVQPNSRSTELSLGRVLGLTDILTMSITDGQSVAR